MDTESMIRELRVLEELHKKDFVNFGEVRWSDLCHDVANRLEELTNVTCEGCKHKGNWENEIELGYNSPCTSCKRRANDNYEMKWF